MATQIDNSHLPRVINAEAEPETTDDNLPIWMSIAAILMGLGLAAIAAMYLFG